MQLNGSAVRGADPTDPLRCGGWVAMRRIHTLARHLAGRTRAPVRGLASSAPDSRAPVALIVGAGDATGGAIARRFARDGFTVCAVRRNGDKLAGLIDDISASGGAARAYGVDARKEEEVAEMVASIERDVGPIDVCVHNIGANVRFPILDTTSRVYFKCWEMVAMSAFLVGREVARAQVERGHGTIIFTGATASTRGRAGFSAFSGAMHGKRSLAQSMAHELGPKGIHVAHGEPRQVATTSAAHTAHRRGPNTNTQSVAHRHLGNHLRYGHPARQKPTYPPRPTALSVVIDGAIDTEWIHTNFGTCGVEGPSRRPTEPTTLHRHRHRHRHRHPRTHAPPLSPSRDGRESGPGRGPPQTGRYRGELRAPTSSAEERVDPRDGPAAVLREILDRREPQGALRSGAGPVF